MWLGLGVVVRSATLPRPPPTCPTITMEVGTVFAVVAPGGLNNRLFVRLIVRLVCPAVAMGTVITTGDHVPAIVVVHADAGFNAAHVVVEPVTAVPQK